MVYNEKSKRSRKVGVLDERGEPVDTVVKVVVAKAHGRVVEPVAELEHGLVFEEGVPLRGYLSCPFHNISPFLP